MWARFKESAVLFTDLSQLSLCYHKLQEIGIWTQFSGKHIANSNQSFFFYRLLYQHLNATKTAPDCKFIAHSWNSFGHANHHFLLCDWHCGIIVVLFFLNAWIKQFPACGVLCFWCKFYTTYCTKRHWFCNSYRVPNITSWLHTFSPYQSQWSVKDHLWSTGSVNPCCFEDSWHSMGKIIQKINRLLDFPIGITRRQNTSFFLKVKVSVVKPKLYHSEFLLN